MDEIEHIIMKRAKEGKKRAKEGKKKTANFVFFLSFAMMLKRGRKSGVLTDALEPFLPSSCMHVVKIDQKKWERKF